MLLEQFSHLADPVRLVIAGLSVGAVAGLFLPGHRESSWRRALLLGAGTSLGAGLVARGAVGPGFGDVRLVTAVFASCVALGTYVLVQRARMLPRC